MSGIKDLDVSVKVKSYAARVDNLIRIGELSARAKVSTRSLRYYEQQGLLKPERSANGYRAYPPASVQVVQNIRLLLNAGLGTDTVRGLLPCMVDSQSFVTCPALLAVLDQQLAAADQRLATQARTRQLLAELRERATRQAS